MNYAALIPLFPLIGFVIVAFFGKRIKNEKLIGGMASSAILASFVTAVMVFVGLVNRAPEDRTVIVKVYSWIATGSFNVDVAYQFDQLSILFTLIITGIGFLIHVYSIGYMHGDKGFPRFFAYLNLFVFMMLNLVLASNFLLTFLGWEGVGLASYLLIGFWYDRKFDGTKITWTGDAAMKAFVVNRIGDFGVLLAMFMLFNTFGTLDYATINAQAPGVLSVGGTAVTVITLLLFLGCTGKSAQIPLGIWLPDAMAGPTPVSALIHAATMVTSGIFLIARTNVLFAMSPTTLAVVAGIGITTALIAGTIGIAQRDIKKVLAYSTVSQLGFMFVALGVGAFTAGVFHVMTHAFFKALLFLGAGSVIHGMHHEQDIMKMGGLKKYMPITYRTFFIGTLAISGIPFLSGFFSKDEILWFAFLNGSPVLWAVGAVAAFTTAFYMWRVTTLTFDGTERFDHHHLHPHESPSTMTIPLIVLAFLSIFGGFLGVPHVIGHAIHFPNLLEHWLEPIFASGMSMLPVHGGDHTSLEIMLMTASTVLAILGILFAKRIYANGLDKATVMAAKFKGLYQLLLNKYYVDEIYHMLIAGPIVALSRDFLWKIADVVLIDGAVNGSARVVGATGSALRKIQSGVAQNYALVMMAGIVILVAMVVFPFLR
ncbi:MAG: NADH-quinone oxidoreductase subunit L [Candidatus Kapabacteria bacterium]|nr:NADH-quinone oxidoreductase subunit L [Ignavibacteria bacterium]MBP6509587.1 NADH-quinone oxidoreductase subunit L [Candidatus Kapabacteria bacterium]MBK6420240.1 NADH-quinone oxidoreductase subunit L [Ignavibacteria bacterium]MBK7412810.1 NADH-quinone oxidoreductase subunit L [Ignavibacteria bacterium]MBL0321673.1 NADH-quinone oxidoreductase subunit L [Ignavibacteria bacterium]